jgi:S1-C subfamily serine protease
MRLEKMSRSLVLVKTAIPYHIDGQNFTNYSGTGLVIDADSGLVIVDRNTVPVKMAQVTITFAGIAEVPAKVLSINPLHSYALIQYNPKLLAGSKIRSASLSREKLNAGNAVWLVGYQTGNRLISEKLNVSSFDPLVIPNPRVPQFKETNTNAVTINNPPAVASGVLMDKRGKVRSWWTNFSIGNPGNQTLDRGLPVSHILDMKKQWLDKGKIDWFSLDVELSALSIATARNYGLSDSWMNRFQSESELAQVLQVARRVAGSEAFEKLNEGDLLLAIDGKLVSDFQDVDRLIRSSKVNLSIWRGGEEKNIMLQPTLLNSTDTEIAYLWSGALLQAPHRAIAAQYGVEQQGVYISWFWYGSPANRFGLQPLNRIIEIEGVEVKDLEQFIALTKTYKDKSYLRIRLLDLIGRESIITLKPDEHYWPTQLVAYEEGAWINRLVEGLPD